MFGVQPAELLYPKKQKNGWAEDPAQEILQMVPQANPA